MEILYVDKDIVVISKPPLMPSQSDPSGDMDAMRATSHLLKERGEDDTLFLIHRLDRVVGGVLIFARNKNACATLNKALAEGKITKEYLAVVDGVTEDSGTFEDYLIKDASTSRAHSVPKERKGAKYARLSFHTLARVSDGDRPLSLVRVKLDTGRFHQIRIQFSTRRLPLLGDGKYGSKTNKCKVSLFAFRLTFPHLKGEKTVCAYPDFTAYPWCLFDKEEFPL